MTRQMSLDMPPWQAMTAPAREVYKSRLDYVLPYLLTTVQWLRRLDRDDTDAYAYVMDEEIIS